METIKELKDKIKSQDKIIDHVIKDYFELQELLRILIRPLDPMRLKGTKIQIGRFEYELTRNQYRHYETAILYKNSDPKKKESDNKIIAKNVKLK